MATRSCQVPKRLDVAAPTTGTVRHLVLSRSSAEVEITGLAGAVLRGDPDEFRVSDGVSWGVGTSFPSRSALRALVEWQGEFVIKDNTLLINPPYVAEDGSIAPLLSPISDPTNFKFGGVWQASNGIFVHGGANYSFGTESRTVGGLDIEHNSWGFDIRVGWHPGVTPARERVRVIKETTTVTNTVTPPPTVPPRPRPEPYPTFTVNATCNPCIVEPGHTSNLTATATYPDGDSDHCTNGRPASTFNNPNAATRSGRRRPGGQLPSPLRRGTTGAYRDQQCHPSRWCAARRSVRGRHFDFDRFNLRPDALKILTMRFTSCRLTRV